MASSAVVVFDFFLCPPLEVPLVGFVDLTFFLV